MNDWKRKFIIIWMGQLFSILTSTVAQFAIILWVSVEAGPAEVLSLPAVIGLTATGLVADRIGIPAMFLLGGVAASLVALVSFFMPSLRALERSCASFCACFTCRGTTVPRHVVFEWYRNAVRIHDLGIER